MKPNTFIAAIAVAAASAAAIPAAAQTFTPGHIQLSRSVGVEPGTLTTSQLILLDAAQKEDGAAGRFKAQQILKNAGAERFSTSGNAVSDVNRSILLEDAQRENNEFLIAQRSKDVVNNTGSDRGIVSPGKAQLAASLGLNAADYTTAELVAVDTQRTFSENSKN